MSSKLKKVFLSLLCLFLPQTANAQQISGTSNSYLLSIKGLVIGTTLKIDADFAKKYGHTLPAPFSILVPTSDEIIELVDPDPQDGDSLIKIHFATPEKRPIENIQFVTMNVEVGDTKLRLDALAKVLVENAYKQVIAGHTKPTRDVVRATKIGKYDAVEVIGTYEDAKFGLVYTRIVGILNPDKPQGVVAFANVIAENLKLEKPDDFLKTRGSAMLRNFTYLQD